MKFERATQTTDELRAAIKQARHRLHGNVAKGKLILAPEVFGTAGSETNVVISPFSILDCTGSIHIGSWCNIGARSRIYTHDHCHQGNEPLFSIQEKHGVIFQDKYIGSDVWIHENSLVLYQASILPDGFVLGAGSVLTKNPGSYEIWAGVPARKIADRKDLSPAEIKACFGQPGFSLKDYLHLDTLKETKF
jgi:acetyltransferase-like isoleucine patch superfamily enzyme